MSTYPSALIGRKIRMEPKTNTGYGWSLTLEIIEVHPFGFVVKNSQGGLDILTPDELMGRYRYEIL